MRKTLAELAALVGGKVVGDAGLVITGLSGIKEAQEGDLSFLANSKYIPLAKRSKAAALLVSSDITLPDVAIIRTDNPSLAFAKIIAAVTDEVSSHQKGIHSSAIISSKARVGKDVAIGAYAIVEDHVEIGDGTVIYGGCYIGHHTKVGKKCLFYPNVTLRESLAVGDRVIVHSGAVIGSDGFGFVQVDGVHEKIPQIGTVVIGDDVEIGANVTIDRARFDKTVIGKGTKIDNLVQIAHNVVIGEHCIIISQVGISGSTTIGDGAILAGQVGTAGHLTIGAGAVVAARAGITKSIPPKAKVSGFPAQPHADEQRWQAALRKVPAYLKVIEDLTFRVEALEKRLKKQNFT